MNNYKTHFYSLLLLFAALGFSYAYLWVVALFSSYEFYAYLDARYWVNLLFNLPMFLVPPALLSFMVWLNWREFKVTTGTTRGLISGALLAVGVGFFFMFSLVAVDPVLGISAI